MTLLELLAVVLILALVWTLTHSLLWVLVVLVLVFLLAGVGGPYLRR